MVSERAAMASEVAPVRRRVTKLAVTHDLTGAPKLNSVVAGESESNRGGRRLAFGTMDWQKMPLLPPPPTRGQFV